MPSKPPKCPRCGAAITAAPDEAGFVVCPACHARLRTRPPAVVKVQGAPPKPPPPDIDSVLARLDAPPNPSATLPPGTPLKPIPRPAGATAPGATPAPFDTILSELRDVRRLQEEALHLLRGQGGPAGEPVRPGPEPGTLGLDGLVPEPTEPESPGTPPATSPVRSRRRKSVLLIDDDDLTRGTATHALEHADVPVRAVAGGSEGLTAIAEEKPDVIVMELGVAGSMAGKDVINMIKATMEWVDVPIVLYTRLPIESQKEARTIHGADEVVLKTQGPEALVAKVIQVFRRG